MNIVSPHTAAHGAVTIDLSGNKLTVADNNAK